MKKVFLSVLFLITAITLSKAQSYIGLTTENYAGVHGLIHNPASIADSRYTADINALGGSIFIANDYYGFDFSKMMKNGYNPDRQATKTPLATNNLLSNIDILGPSFMMTIGDKENNAIGFTSRMRVFYGGKGVNGQIAQNLGGGINSNEDFSLKQEEDVFVSGTQWMEFGGSFARILQDKGKHFIKAGASLKYLKGMSNAYARSNALTLDYDATSETMTGGGEVIYGYSENLKTGNEESFFADKANGFSADLGVVYELRTDSVSSSVENNKYKLRIGLSVTDLGMLNFKGNDSAEETYNMNTPVGETDFETMDDFEDLKDFYTKTTIENMETAILPATIHLDADYNFMPKIYANLSVNYSLNSKKVNRSHSINYVSLIPRYESKWFSAYMPISFVQYSQLNWGAGFRAGPLYIGSGSLFTTLMSKKAKGTDAYIGVKVPLFRKNRIKDKDEDGVLDENDKCPEVAGISENNGCPSEDKDEDGIPDHKDNCPEEKGDKKNDGCPWGDADGDGVNDNEDRCPDVPGVAENKGCPSDKDGDGVYDLEDECPEKVGTVAGKGCPEFSEKEQKKLNSYAKTILFNTGKSSIREQSNEVLKEIIAILQEYPNAKFSIDGHTDSVGSAGMNQKLSDARANQVKKYLVDNGIDEFRLSSEGFGEEKPISSNKTKNGRLQNRRVEINLVRE